ncbi:MAG: hypothetical protein IT258_13845 [Saprospiraceae bacterium]|nr:hypothetical protein [Saprospiraceae bacterium]
MMNKTFVFAFAIFALIFTNCKSDKPSPEGGEIAPPEVVAPVSTGKAELKICTLERLKNSIHCCTEDLQKISIFESNSVLHLTGHFPDLAGKTAAVTGNVLWDTGENFPTKPITMVQDTSFGESCYVGEIQPINGVQWKLRKYKLQLQVDGKPYMEKVFEMDR